MPDADVLFTYANIDKARRLLGFAPRTSVKEGVEHFWNWHRDAVLHQG